MLSVPPKKRKKDNCFIMNIQLVHKMMIIWHAIFASFYKESLDPTDEICYHYTNRIVNYIEPNIVQQRLDNMVLAKMPESA